MKRHNIPYIILLAALCMAACTDTFINDILPTADDEDGMLFSLDVKEHCDLAYETGSTRATADNDPADQAAIEEAFRVRQFDGEAEGVSLHTLMLPFMGIHPRTVTSDAAPETRAASSSVIPAGNNQLTFHDSLTIWGYAYNTTAPYSVEEPYTRTLFNQILLKKIRGWRSSVHWPYDDGKADKMRFYAVAPALESMDIQITNSANINYSTAPTFKYVVPNNVDEQRDLLYGESEAIDVQSGPDGTGRYPGDTPRERHLGDDDKIVGLTFKHILTCLRFAQGRIPEGMTVNKITLSNIKNTGTYHPADADGVTFPSGISGTGDVGSGNWVLDNDSKGTYVINIDPTWTSAAYQPGTPTTSGINGENIYHNGSGENVYLTDEVLFVMPHVVTNDATIQIDGTINIYEQNADGTIQTDGSGNRIVKNTRDIKLRTTLEGCYWKKGFTVTYYLTIGNVADDYYLLVEPDASYTLTGDAVSAPDHGAVTYTSQYQQGEKTFEYNQSGGGSFTIHSYRNYKSYAAVEGGTNLHHKAVSWTIAGFADTRDGTYTTTKPNWITLPSTLWDNGGPKTQTPGSAITGETGTGYVNDGSTLGYMMNEQSAAYQIKHDDVLKANTFTVTDDEISSTQYLDLSQRTPNGNGFDEMGTFTKNRPLNTANCYIVNSGGNYKIPLVYGNAIQNGSEVLNNSSEIFVDHLGRPITHANIFSQINYDTIESTTAYSSLTTEEQEKVETGGYKQQITEIRYGGSEHTGDVTADLAWQDATYLINTPSVIVNPTSGSYGYIGFTLSNANLQPGNALIVLKGKKRTKTVTRLFKSDGTRPDGDSDVTVSAESTASTPETLWTWHIWVTDEVLPNNSTVTADQKYISYNTDTNSKIVQLKNASGENVAQILPVNLGWVPDHLTQDVYQPREVWIKIQQTEKKSTDPDYQTAYVKIRQEAKQDLITGTSTVYQWGRPTALPMVNYISGTTRTIYNGSSSDITSSFAIATVSSDYVANAITQPTKIIKATTKNWWSGTANNLFWDTNKTLYDPCPPGFQMPAKSLFEFLVYTSPVADNTEYTTLNMWLGNYESNKGGYFYTTKRTSAPSSAERYGPMIYLPASGYYSGNNDNGTLMTVQQKDKPIGYLWTTDHASYEEGSSIYFGTSNGNVKFVTEENNDLRPVRPRGQ